MPRKLLKFQFIFPALCTLLFSLLAAIFYRRKFEKNDVAFMVVLQSVLIFSIVSFIPFDEHSLGLGIGLLGILSLIRLRSSVDNLLDIGFVFFAIALGLLNASVEHWGEILIIDFCLTGLLLALASNFAFGKKLLKTQIVFDEIFFKSLQDEQLLRKRIEEKFAVKPHSIKVLKINQLKDSATVEIFFEI